MAQNSEFKVENAYQYSQAGTWRWILAHIWRYWGFGLVVVGSFIAAWLAYSEARIQIGRAAEEMINPSASGRLLTLSLGVLGLLIIDGVTILIGGYAAENIGARLEADARQELYASLLGKSQTFHDRQRVGDLMARATDDASQLKHLVVPGATMLFETILGLIVPLAFIIRVSPQLVLAPLGFVACYIVAVRRYMRKLNPVMEQQRAQFGALNAGLEETISGIEVVKATARELFERGKFYRNARKYRDLLVQQGQIEARYLALLIYGVALGLTFLHAMLLYRAGQVGIADIIAVMGLMYLLRFPAFISLFAFTLVQSGAASAGRILAVIRAETELDENRSGHSQPISGAISFEQVEFGFETKTVLNDISLTVQPGQTVAIVGQTGSGKTALTQLINRTYDVGSGRVLIDGIDVREWNLDSLRSQISKIEQDVFLFSRTIAENIAFGDPQADRATIEAAAQSAQAHEFISSFAEGYDTMVGERGVTLSGGQRQRIALARAFLSDPRILILDDSTSAVDSATEDAIQKALRRAQAGRTTILITHRLSQIRWADQIVVLDQGQIVASGPHDQLLRQSPHYRRIFARFDAALPPFEPAAGLG